MRKGIGYMIEGFLASLTILVFAVGAQSTAQSQDWTEYRTQVEAQDLTETLQNTDLQEIIQRGETGTLRTYAVEVSDDSLELSGSLNLPLREYRVGFNTRPPQRQKDELEDAGDNCTQSELNEIDTDPAVTDIRTPETEKYGADLYVADTDPQTAGGGNGFVDYDTLYVDNRSKCQFSSSEGPFYEGDYFNYTNSSGANAFQLEEIGDPGDEIVYHNASQVLRLEKPLNRPLNGVETTVNFDTLWMPSAELNEYDLLVFRRKSSVFDTMDTNLSRLQDFSMQGGAILLMSDLRETDFSSSSFLQSSSLDWVEMSMGSYPTTCRHTGKVVLDSDCTFGPGEYFLDNLTVKSGVEVKIENLHQRCNVTYRGPGCSNTNYTEYAPKIVVDGPVEIESGAVINASYEGFVNASDSSNGDRGGPGAGEPADKAGGGGHAGEGGDSSSGATGGPSYSEEAERLGSAGGRDPTEPPTPDFCGPGPPNPADPAQENQCDTIGDGPGQGGGALWIQTNSRAEINGEILARGRYGGPDAGGGAGGSIRLQGKLEGSPELRADGGVAIGDGGSGGGGFVYVESSETLSSFSPDVNVSSPEYRSSGNDGDDGSYISNVDSSYERQTVLGNFSENSNSNRLETFFRAQGGIQGDIDIFPGGRVSSTERRPTSENPLFYASSYAGNQFNVSNFSMSSPSSVPPGTVESECYDSSTIPEPSLTNGTVELRDGTGSTKTHEIVNVELGNSSSFCTNNEVRGVMIDFDRDDVFEPPVEGPFIREDVIEIQNREFRPEFPGEPGEAVSLVNLADPPEMIAYSSGYFGGKLARLGYEEEYSVEDRRTIASLIYLLLPETSTFGSGGGTVSLSVLASTEDEIYMPYRLNMRWRRR